MSMDEVIDRLRTDPDELKKWVGVYIVNRPAADTSIGAEN